MGPRPRTSWSSGPRRSGLTGLAVTDRNGLYGAVRFMGAAEEIGLHGGRRDGDRAARPGRPGSRPASSSRHGVRGGAAEPRPGDADLGVDRRGRPSIPPTPRARPAARPSRPGQGGPARDRRAGAWSASRAARPLGGRLAEPVAAHLPGEPGRDQGRATLPPGPPRRASRGPRRAVGLSRRGDRAPPAGRRSGRGAGGRGALRDAVRAWRRPRLERLLHRALASPPARRRLARGGVGGARRGARAAGRRHQRRPLRDARRPRAARRPDRDQARPDARDARRPAPARRRVAPQVGRRAGGARCVVRSGDRRERGARGSPRRSSWRRRARSISASSSTASRASRCRRARRRSRISSSCARPAPGSAITR